MVNVELAYELNYRFSSLHMELIAYYKLYVDYKLYSIGHTV